MVSPLPKLLMGVTLHHLYFRGTVHNMPIICNQESFYWLRTSYLRIISHHSPHDSFGWPWTPVGKGTMTDDHHRNVCLFSFVDPRTLMGLLPSPISPVILPSACCCSASLPNLEQSFYLKSFHLQISKVFISKSQKFLSPNLKSGKCRIEFFCHLTNP